MTSKVIWLYGMSGSGKTTLGRLLSEDLGYLLVDGDVMRRFMNQKPDFTSAGRQKFQMLLRAEVQKMQEKGLDVVVASITPYANMREANRFQFGKYYFEVHIHCDLSVLITRDPKGLYKRSLSEEIHNFTGISDPFEVGFPDYTIDTTQTSINKSYTTLKSAVCGWLGQVDAK